MDLPTSWPHSVGSLWFWDRPAEGANALLTSHALTRHSYMGEAVHVRSDHRGGTACVQGDRNTLFPLDPSRCSVIGFPAHGLFLSRAFLPGEFSSGGASSARLLHPREVMCFLGDALLTHPDWLYISFPCEAFAPIPTNLTSDFFPSSPLSVGYRVSCLILDWWL